MPEIHIQTPPGFVFDRAVRSHGWFDLAPFAYDRAAATLAFAFQRGAGVVAVTLHARGAAGPLVADIATRGATSSRGLADDVTAVVRSVLRLDQDLASLRAALAPSPALGALLDAGGGRLLRAPTVFEDVVKMLCTTNCSWSLTRVMVQRLVDKAGAAGPGGARAFPTPEALAARPLAFFRDGVHAGYRAPYLEALATRVARGSLDLESLRDPARPAEDVYATLRSIVGIGPYAADNLMRLVGHNDRLGLDSWCRARYVKLYPRAPKTGRALDAAIARRYRRFAPHQGLAMWLDLTRTWHDPDAPATLTP
jgi:3-methyladenine DNA glycosylase/8-oxoguanine DNA glycosylase